MEMSSKKNNDYEVVLKEVGGIKSGPVPLRVAMEICARCGTCAQQCPVDAIEMRPWEKHEIDSEKCIRCDTCKKTCPEDAIKVE